VSFTDLCAMSAELGIVVALGAALLRDLTAERKRLVLLVVAVVLVSVGHLVHLMLR